MNEAVYQEIRKLAESYAAELQKQVDNRVAEMQSDDRSHSLIYRILGVSDDEGVLIDIYQNKGRFLYNYAGAFLEEATQICMKHRYPQAKKIRIPNQNGSRPKTFEIDCLVDKLAHEIKWRDATTDGDHITKEHSRIQAIRSVGYVPIRVMFYYPQRTQAIQTQKTLETLYQGIGGQYYYGENAWTYIKEFTDIDLLEILERIAGERV